MSLNLFIYFMVTFKPLTNHLKIMAFLMVALKYKLNRFKSMPMLRNELKYHLEAHVLTIAPLGHNLHRGEKTHYMNLAVPRVRLVPTCNHAFPHLSIVIKTAGKTAEMLWVQTDQIHQYSKTGDILLLWNILEERNGWVFKMVVCITSYTKWYFCTREKAEFLKSVCIWTMFPRVWNITSKNFSLNAHTIIFKM